MSEKHQSAAGQLMEQAQVFASAWALIDGPFDGGQALQNAEEAKEELRDMIDSLLAAQSEEAERVIEAIQQLIDWHADRVAKLKTFQEGAKAGVTVDFGGDQIVLSEDMAKGIRIALVVALSFLGKLPISLNRPE